MAPVSKAGESRSRNVRRSTLTDQLEDALRADIIEGVLPPGHRIRAGDLSERYGVSATPLREALQRLAGQGLVDLDPRLGPTVARASLADLRDIYWLRALLEDAALERSLRRGDAGWEQRLHQAWREYALAATSRNLDGHEEMEAWLSAHRALHNALMAGGDSPWLTRFVTMLAEQSERYRMMSVRTHTRASLDEHKRLYDMAIRRDVAGAVAANREHLARTVQVLESTFLANVAEPVTSVPSQNEADGAVPRITPSGRAALSRSAHD